MRWRVNPDQGQRVTSMPLPEKRDRWHGEKNHVSCRLSHPEIDSCLTFNLREQEVVDEKVPRMKSLCWWNPCSLPARDDMAWANKRYSSLHPVHHSSFCRDELREESLDSVHRLSPLSLSKPLLINPQRLGDVERLSVGMVVCSLSSWQESSFSGTGNTMPYEIESVLTASHRVKESQKLAVSE